MDRRFVLKAGGATLLSAAATPLFDPRIARAQGAPFKVLSAAEVATIEVLSNAIVPGARDAGVSHYIDHELASPSPRLLLRFAQLRGPLLPYYRGALAAFAVSMKEQGKGEFSALAPDAQGALLEAMRTGKMTPWDAKAVPTPVFFGMMRNDGVDVVYGSAEGFEKLGMPYMPHIMPKTTW